MNDNQLLPCPFCGGEAKRESITPYRKIKGRGQSYRATIGCRTVGCTVSMSQAAFDKETAWEYAEGLWNRRAEPANEMLEASITAQETLQTAIEQLTREKRDAINELCNKCGRYREEHNGACDGCRWHHA